MHIAGINIIAAVDTAAIHQHPRAVFENVLDRVIVEILIDVRHAVRIGLVMAAAQGLGSDRPCVFHPTEVIDDMDVKITVAAAAGPEETVEALYLPEQFAWVARPFGGEGR